MTNLLDIVNYVLRRLRMPEVTNLDDTFSKLLVDFVNQTQEEVTTALDWSNQRNTYSIDTEVGAYTYELDNLNHDFLLQFVWNDSDNVYLSKVSDERMVELQTGSGAGKTGTPTVYALNGRSVDNTNPIIDFYPIPDSIKTLRVYVSDPAAVMAEITDAPTIDPYLIAYGTIAKAIQDRGAATDQEVQKAEMYYKDRLRDRISIELQNLGEGDWRTV